MRGFISRLLYNIIRNFIFWKRADFTLNSKQSVTGCHIIIIIIQSVRFSRGISFKAKLTFYTGQVNIYTTQVNIYTGQNNIYTGQVNIYSRQVNIYTNQINIYTGQVDI